MNIVTSDWSPPLSIVYMFNSCNSHLNHSIVCRVCLMYIVFRTEMYIEIIHDACKIIIIVIEESDFF